RLTACSAVPRRYSLAGRPAPGPPTRGAYDVSSSPASVSLSRWNAARVRPMPSASATSLRLTGCGCPAANSYTARRTGSRSAPIASRDMPATLPAVPGAQPVQDLRQLVRLDEDVARLGTLGRPDDTAGLHQVHEPPRLGEAHP